MNANQIRRTYSLDDSRLLGFGCNRFCVLRAEEHVSYSLFADSRVWFPVIFTRVFGNVGVDGLQMRIIYQGLQIGTGKSICPGRDLLPVNARRRGNLLTDNTQYLEKKILSAAPLDE